MKPQTTYWIKHFKQNSEYGYLRFKKLTKGFAGYPTFEFDETLIDEVDIDTFIKKEESRIPLFIGTPMGLYPALYEIPNFLSEDKIVAILSKSLLTGHVAGLRFYRIQAGSLKNEREELIFFNNEEKPFEKSKC
jgi:hypothetical protein